MQTATVLRFIVIRIVTIDMHGLTGGMLISCRDGTNELLVLLLQIESLTVNRPGDDGDSATVL